jgi:N-methylhydantoinase A
MSTGRWVQNDARWFELRTPIYRREALTAGGAIEGPAVVEEIDATLLVHPGQQLNVDDYGVITLVLDAHRRMS